MDDKTMPSNENLDPISGEPGAHPIGTGVGATLGAVAAGAAVGSVAGPAGTVIGMAIGAALGGLGGKGVAESLEPTAEEAHWRREFRSRPYVTDDARFDSYGPAYRYGVTAFGTYDTAQFELVEPELAQNWVALRGPSDLSWGQARPAVKDAWDRMRELDARDIPVRPL